MELSNPGEFHFLYPAWLYAIAPMLLLAAWFLWRQRSAGNWTRVVDADLLPALRLQNGDRKNSPWILIGLAWAAAALALAGPTWQRVESAAFRAPADWVILLDLSPSMGAQDLTPDRTTRAHYAIDDLLRGAQDARVGLIAFAGEAHTVVPLTSDVATIRALLQPLKPSIMPESGNALAPALDQASSLLRQAASRGGRIIVMTDGFDDPTQALAAASRLRSDGATVDVVGVGTASGAPQPDGQGSFVQDSAGRVVVAKLPTDLLRRLSAAGGGRYWPIESIPALIAALHAEHGNPLDQYSVATRLHIETWRNGGYWLLPLVLLFATLLARRGWL